MGGFLSRWSKRKSGEKQEPLAANEGAIKTPSDLNKAENAQAADTPPPVTLEDVEKIDRFDPDFSAFMKPDVDPQVQQAALKKMFTDPHFNVMDGLDIYIDDYSKPDPLPPGMLERMVQSEMLNLFRKKEGDIDVDAKDAELKISSAETDSAALVASPQTDLTSSNSVSTEMTEDVNVAPTASNKKKT